MIGDIVKTIVGPIIGRLVDKIEDPNEAARLKAEAENDLLEAVTGVVQGQLAINRVEAQHASIFVAGWRPAVGWVCALAVGWNFLIQPLVMWFGFFFGADLTGAPKLDMTELLTLLGGILGLGGYRSFEKSRGVARTHLITDEVK